MVEGLRAQMTQKCDEINAATEALGVIHRHTPTPDVAPTYVAQPFEEPMPVQPPLKGAGFGGSLFGRSRAQNIEGIVGPLSTAVALYEQHPSYVHEVTGLLRSAAFRLSSNYFGISRIGLVYASSGAPAASLPLTRART